MKQQKKKAIKAASLVRTDLKVLPKNASLEKLPLGIFKYCYTTGPFSIPENSGSLDWILLNNDSTSQRVRVTIFQCAISAVKIAMAPGPIIVTLAPGNTTHNANTYPEGYVYEVQVECNSQLIFPYVSVWPENFGVSIPGTNINSAMFLRLMN